MGVSAGPNIERDGLIFAIANKHEIVVSQAKKMYTRLFSPATPVEKNDITEYQFSLSIISF